MNVSMRLSRAAGLGLLALVLVPPMADAQRGGGMMARSSVSSANRASQMAMDKSRQSAAARNSGATRPTGNSGRSTSRDVNRTTSREVSRDVDIDMDDNHWGNGEIDHPIAATAMVAATTAAVVGAFYPSVPAGCPIVNTYSVPYYHCNGVYYEQRMQGDDVVYVVVNP
ncbi:hypothetical protein [Lysobacter claricitrinus]|uniref:hypothetical protein n=1 Tax=Lysobacter claricitrinus TaxID=3367728 RepID=UPI0037DB5B46